MLSKKVYIAGHLGMVGSALHRAHINAGHLEHDIITRTREELDLCNQADVSAFFDTERPDHVYLAAAKVGGIHGNNTYPADFIYENLMIQTNVISAAFRTGVKQLIFLGSSCIYPKLAEQPMKETTLLKGPLEATNEPYAIAKIAGIKLCESLNRQYGVSHGIDYRCLMPTNLYGPGDNYHPTNSHVIPGLIRRFHEAKLANATAVKVWGSGNAKREFLHVDDLAAACLHVMNVTKNVLEQKITPQCSHINIGYGEDVSISELAYIIKKVVDFNGKIEFDQNMPDGTPRKLLDSSMIQSLGWRPSIHLFEGLQRTYADFLSNRNRF